MNTTYTTREEKPRWRRRLLIILLIIIMLVLLLFGLYRCGIIGHIEGSTAFSVGAGVKSGERPGTEIASGEAGSNGKADMTVRINGYPVFPDGASPGNLNIENPKQNVLYLEVQITLDDTGEVIYESGLIPPDHYIGDDVLARLLEKGEYKATAHATLVDPDNRDAVYNSANFNLVITVQA